MSAHRTYSKATDFGGSYNSENFENAIRDPANGVTRQLDYINEDGDSIELYFVGADPLSSGDEASLDAIVAAHNATPVEPPQEPKLVEVNEIENGTKSYHQVAFPDLEIAGPDPDGFTDLVLPYDFWFLSIEFYAGPGSGAVLGDRISALISPLLPLHLGVQAHGIPASEGEIKGALAINDTEVDVSSILMGNEDLIEGFFRIGASIWFEDPGNPGNPHATEYVIVGHDRVNNRLTLARYDTANQVFITTNVLTEAYALGSKIWRTIVAGREINVLPTYDGNQYGGTKIGSSKLPAGTTFRVVYKKKTGDTDVRHISVNIEGMVGDRPE